MTSGPPSRSADAARTRLLQDQARRPLAEDRARLLMLSERLDRAARTVLAQHLAARVGRDRRFAPVLGDLLRIALRG